MTMLLAASARAVSDLESLADIGILLVFMLLMNMAGILFLLPAMGPLAGHGATEPIARQPAPHLNRSLIPTKKKKP